MNIFVFLPFVSLLCVFVCMFVRIAISLHHLSLVPLSTIYFSTRSITSGKFRHFNYFSGNNLPGDPLFPVWAGWTLFWSTRVILGLPLSFILWIFHLFLLELLLVSPISLLLDCCRDRNESPQQVTLLQSEFTMLCAVRIYHIPSVSSWWFLFLYFPLHFDLLSWFWGFSSVVCWEKVCIGDKIFETVHTLTWFISFSYLTFQQGFES